MSITDRIPGLRGSGSHRAVDEVDRLRRDLFRMRADLCAAEDEIALLQQDLTVARYRQGEAEEIVISQQADLIDLSEERDALAAEVAELRRQLAPYLAAEANANAVSLPPLERDTSDPADQATGPIDVRPLWDKPGIGPVLNPGQTSWGAARETAEGVA